MNCVHGESASVGDGGSMRFAILGPTFADASDLWQAKGQGFKYWIRRRY